MPDVLGEGIALPEPIFKSYNLELIGTIEHQIANSSIVEKRYKNH